MTTKNDDREIHVNELFKLLKFLEVHQQFNLPKPCLKCTQFSTVHQTGKFSLILDMKYQKDDQNFKFTDNWNLHKPCLKCTQFSTVHQTGKSSLVLEMKFKLHS